MKAQPLMRSVLTLAVGSTLFGGCVVRERHVHRRPPPPTVVTQEVVVTGAPPPSIVETVTVSPGPDYVWIGGNWIWKGHWVWERGHWDRPPRVGVIWVPHRYEYRGGVHVFVRGGWR